MCDLINFSKIMVFTCLENPKFMESAFKALNSDVLEVQAHCINH